MKRFLRWVGTFVAIVVVFCALGFGISLVKKDSLANHLIDKRSTTVMVNNHAVSSSTSNKDDTTSTAPKLINVSSILNDNSISGQAAAIVKGKLKIRQSRGFSNTTKDEKNTNLSGFLIGKIQDNINAGIILHLVDQGKLKLSTTVSKYDSTLPGASQITLKDVINQSSGITSVSGSPIASVGSQMSWADSNASFDESQIGQYADSNLNTIISSYIIQKATGKKYETVLNEFFESAGMRNSKVGSLKDAVSYYQMDPTVGVKSEVSSDELNVTDVNRAGDSPVISTAADVAKLCAYIFNGSYIKNGTWNNLLKNGHAAGFLVSGNDLSMAQALTGGRNRVEWHRSNNTGVVLLSNYVTDSNSLSNASTQIFNKLK
ncbi:serine hydrolase domain-containing protein [Pediococcus claussenii]|uniref:Beta-lactamase family protein n=1 Tax=Pediococcus claussenii (strain ATCC BAA-344 / DSM 14800 / JCM 18046 / KCTC 3811 / LMG 21948 / P06) TaxID=701521 RepID=G8PE08_PEDCP|nr:serine hydrolase domain-containing protein [Pediococcus claussenii]AEV95493.1 beta-lactamase family protein [Pediococcus claussenii ATCC BAA-344]ANZ69017.1 hypothetical protein AYR57_01295 [Pediococcus claussenii]ANZ70833.1 hypothetical protein AYR58_01295 [Pediococcus claussenii]KRN20272.1 hypothetical protein IV79_GL000939 [Pediococcus claussenii]